MDWRTFEDETEKLASLVRIKPDIIVPIARGGVIPATLLAKRLHVTDMFMLTMHRESDGRFIASYTLADITGKKILLVEDMIESGESLITGKKYLEERGGQVQTACLYTMPSSKIQPDYFLKEIPVVEEFPWNKAP